MWVSQTSVSGQGFLLWKSELGLDADDRQICCKSPLGQRCKLVVRPHPFENYSGINPILNCETAVLYTSQLDFTSLGATWVPFLQGSPHVFRPHSPGGSKKTRAKPSWREPLVSVTQRRGLGASNTTPERWRTGTGSRLRTGGMASSGKPFGPLGNGDFLLEKTLKD